MRSRSLAVTAISLALLSHPSAAQNAPASATEAAPPGATREALRSDPVQSFLNRTAQRQQRREQALSRRGKGASLRELNGLLNGAALAPPGLGRGAAERAALESSLAVEVAQFLASAGFNAGDVRRSRQRGVDLGEAASATIRGQATFQQHAALAESVVVAEVAGEPVQSTGDGFESSTPFRVVDSLKGDLAAGATFQLRQLSGAQADVSTDIRAPVGTRFLLLLSSEFYASEAAEAGGDPLPGAVMRLVPGYLVEGDQLRAAGIGQPQVESVAAARAAVAASN